MEGTKQFTFSSPWFQGRHYDQIFSDENKRKSLGWLLRKIVLSAKTSSKREKPLLTPFFLPLLTGMWECDFQSRDRHAVAMAGGNSNPCKTAEQTGDGRLGLTLTSPKGSSGIAEVWACNVGKWMFVFKVILLEHFLNSNLIVSEVIYPLFMYVFTYSECAIIILWTFVERKRIK